MKISDNTRFPYPVLSSHTSDYKNGEFSISLVIEETPSNGRLRIGYKVSLLEPMIMREVENKTAELGIFVTCLETYYNQIVLLKIGEGSVEFLPGLLKGRVFIRPLVWAVKEIFDYSNDNLNNEYNNASWNFGVGSILAVGNEIIINVGHEKLAPMESIFTLAVNGEVPEGEIRVQIDSEQIIILSSANTFHTINNLRATRLGQTILLNSIYLPSIMEVLSHLKDSEINYCERKWFRVFNAKCEHLGIEYSRGNFLEDAQKLLKSPINRINSIGENLI